MKALLTIYTLVSISFSVSAQSNENRIVQNVIFTCARSLHLTYAQDVTFLADEGSGYRQALEDSSLPGKSALAQCVITYTGLSKHFSEAQIILSDSQNSKNAADGLLKVR